MKALLARRRGVAVTAVLVALAGVFAWSAVRAGPLAPVPVTVAAVEQGTISPALYGIATVEARETHRIGPIAAGRVLRVDVQVGDRVRAGQTLAEIDPIDLNSRLEAQGAATARAEANAAVAEAQVRDASARLDHARTQAARYEKLAQAGAASQELYDARRQELLVAEAALASARAASRASRDELSRNRAEGDAMRRVRASLRLVAPVDGLVTARNVDEGSTVVAGQSVVEVVDPARVWLNVRFDQLRSAGLRAGLPARVQLRSRAGEPLAAHTLRVEPVADAVTEELLAKVVFDSVPEPLPALGELAEVTVELAPTPPSPVVSNASVQRFSGKLGVWTVEGDALRFVPVKTGATALDGRVQVLDGLRGGERVVVYSRQALRPGTRFDVVERLP